jgi:drug/metabolite transporter (DMT)-like permease
MNALKLSPRIIMKNIWFKAKEYGWGWYPVTWQGWLVLVVFVALMIANAFRLNGSSRADTIPVEFLVETVVLVGILIGICFWKGEKPGWRWGRRKE